jgi:ferritin-like metal-binding protein YciE
MGTIPSLGRLKGADHDGDRTTSRGRLSMSALKELYIDELKDLWSANDQMQKVVAKMSEAASDERLSRRLDNATDGIAQHTELLRQLLSDAGAEVEKEHCKGMEGLVAEARKHALDSDLTGAALDVSLIAQYQRMCHYGIAGFGTIKAFAEALGEDDAASKLGEALDDIYDSDGFMTELAERSRNVDAAS